MRDDETYEIPVVTAIAARINFTGSEREFFYGGRNNCDTIIIIIRLLSISQRRQQETTFDRKSRNLYIPRVFNAPYGGVEYTWDI